MTAAITQAGEPQPTSAEASAAIPLSGERRPGRRLLHYYIVTSLAAGPGLLVLLPLRYFRFKTLRYVFDDEGVTMRWGVLFRREISLTYARIQDIHLLSNVVERWLGIGRIQVQTASGQSGAEMTIEGLLDYEAVRDRLYRCMRGARGVRHDASEDRVVAAATATPSVADPLEAAVSALRTTVAELQALRADLGARVEPLGVHAEGARADHGPGDR